MSVPALLQDEPIGEERCGAAHQVPHLWPWVWCSLGLSGPLPFRAHSGSCSAPTGEMALDAAVLSTVAWHPLSTSRASSSKLIGVGLRGLPGRRAQPCIKGSHEDQGGQDLRRSPDVKELLDEQPAPAPLGV